MERKPRPWPQNARRAPAGGDAVEREGHGSASSDADPEAEVLKPMPGNGRHGSELTNGAEDRLTRRR